MEEAREHDIGRHGGGTLGLQTDLANHSNSYVGNGLFVIFSLCFEQWKTITMANPLW
jgi:hypothetical protein